MPRFRSGFRRSAREVANSIEILLKLIALGIFIGALSAAYTQLHIPSLIDLNAFYSLVKTLVELTGIISTAFLILKMPYWGTLYMLGWIVGILYFWYLGLVSASDLVVYIVPSIVILAWRVYNKSNYSE